MMNDNDVNSTPEKNYEVHSEDSTGYNCQHCGGNVILDVDKSARHWKVFVCQSCKSNSPLTVDDLMKEMGVSQ